MGKDSGGSSTTVQQQSIPGWLDSMYKNNYAQAKDKVYAQQYVKNPYAAGLPANATLQNAWASAGSQGDAWKPALGQASGMISQAGSTPWSAINPQTYANGLANISQYMNPYIGQVENAALANMQNAFGKNLVTIGDGAAQAGAFGGSRQGVAEGAAASDYARQYGDLSAQLRSQGFQQATQMLGQDISNDLNAQAQNQSSRIDYMRALSAAGLGLGQLAGQGYQMDVNDLQNQMSAGQQQYAVESARNAGLSAEFMRQQDWPLRGVNALIAATPGSAGGTTTTTSPNGSSNPLLGGLGGAMAGASLGNSLAGAGVVGSGAGVGGGTLLGGLLGLFSDRRAKTDIEKLGKDEETGLDLYAYRYKNDPKSYPKVVGPMAQDVEKLFPGLTRKVGGKLMINGLAGAAA